MSTCPEGHENPDHYRHCGACGLRIDATNAPQKQPPPTWPGLAPSYPGQPAKKGFALTPSFLIVTAVVAVVVVLAAVGGIAAVTSGGSSHPTPSTAQLPTPSITGKLSDWEGAVCRTGTIRTGSRGYPNASSQDACQAADRSGIIMIGEWSSEMLMKNDLTALRQRNYASTLLTNGNYVAFAVAPIDGGVAGPLQPLTQFGFTIEKLSGS